MRKPEIMSPAGYWPQLHAAIEAGADAVYFGLKHFTARAKAGFPSGEVRAAMRTLHARGLRGYVTFNTLLFEHELAAAAEAIEALARAGVDALIVQDYAVVALARRIAPELQLHASTQMSITDARGVAYAARRGLHRVTLGRELSLGEVRNIAASSAVELEIFVHGALCVAYSGQCFSSEAWGGRSANRGQCAQACRLPYELIVDGAPAPLGDARYLLSPGDLNALGLMPQIVTSGVAALKIEGRYKDAGYVALVTDAYRKALDAAWSGREAQTGAASALTLEQVYSRGSGPYFLQGTDHQAVVRGRAPRHRGVLMGSVRAVEGDGIVVEPGAAHKIAPLKAGDGVVFDAADWRSPEEPEEGGRIYEVTPAPGGRLRLRFANGAIDASRIRVGDWLWRSHAPDIDRAARAFLEAPAPVARQRVDVHVTAAESAPLVAEWTLASQPGLKVTVVSPEPLAPSLRHGLDGATLAGQLGRLGGTPYELGALTADITGAPFAPVSLLNQLRREAVERLTALQTAGRDSTVGAAAVAYGEAIDCARATLRHAQSANELQLHLLVRTPEQLDAALELAPASITLDYLDLYGLRPSLERLYCSGIAARVASPRIFKPGEARMAEFLGSLGCAVLARATSLLEALRERAGVELHGDFSLNITNSISAADCLAHGLRRITPAHDLNAAQLAGLIEACGGEVIEAIAYQHLPVFHTEHCVFCRFLSTGHSYVDCGRPCETHRVALRDASGRAHAVLADAGCRNTVFGAEAQQAAHHLARWRAAGLRHVRLEFTHENAAQVRAVTQAFQRALAGRLDGVGLERELQCATGQGITEGSLFIAPDYLKLPVLQ